ncbi:LOW QUALITY PROTEIN: hypothetical protein MAR_030915 [Mya arenaria]|uniref:Endonuclease/exonuclease/phosphatase domain-containing protein n=1 Tax=Mya arenaria TaxID=6604 RepID=A0ABY7F5L0_MYAAR|nr:LOW QUALITY PROTEIN: hypothetical protein MAR_030915 [Mya arenaria]
MIWNVTGIFSSSSYLSDVLIEKNVHICGLSEHWLYPHNLDFLNALSMNYNVYAKCDKDLCVTSAKGAGKGGVALLWHKQLDHVVSSLSIDDDRLIGVQHQQSPLQYMYFIQVYLPCSNHTSLILRDYIDKFYSQWGTVVFLGDFNAKYTADSPVTRDRLLYSLLCDTNMHSTHFRYVKELVILMCLMMIVVKV